MIFCSTVKAQSNINPYTSETIVIIQSEDKNGNDFIATSKYGYMKLNTTNGDFLLNLDAIDLKTGNQKLDSNLILKGSQPIQFKGNVNENLFLFNQQINDEKLYNMQGQLIVNNNTPLDCIAQFDPKNFADKADTKNYRMDFKLMVDASKLLIIGLENKLYKQVIIEIQAGKINIQQ